MEFSTGSTQLRETFHDSLTEDAHRLVQRGGVSSVRVLQGGAVVTGIAAAESQTGAGQSSAHRVYVRRRPAGIESECSCGERVPCVHVAAVLIVAAGHTHSQEDARHRAEPATLRVAPDATVDSSSRRQRICYLVEAAGADAANGFRLRVWVAQLALHGGHVQPGSACSFSTRTLAAPAQSEALPRYVDEQDKEILQALTALRGDGAWQLHDAEGAVLLRRIVATGRAFWQALHGAPMKPDELELSLPSGHRCGAPGSRAMARRVPPCSPEARLVVSADLKVTLHFIYGGRGVDSRGGLGVDSGGGLGVDSRAGLGIDSRGGLGIDSRGGLGVDSGGGLGIDSRVARFHSLCGGSRTLHAEIAGVVHEIERDPAGERQLQMQLNQWMPAVPQDRAAWLSFMLDTVPLLRAQRWEVDVADEFPYRIATPERWYADLQTSDEQSARQRPGRGGHQREWFDLQLGVTVDGFDVNLLPALVSYLQSKLEGNAPAQEDRGGAFLHIGDRLLLRLDDSRYLPVPIERIDRIAAALVELFDREALNERQALPVLANQASRIAQLAQDLSTCAPHEPALGELSLRANDRDTLALLEELEAFSGITPLNAPEQFPVTLRPYQEEGLGWLQFLRRCRLGGILADDMGLGKTVQTVAHLALEKQQGRLHRPALIVAPVSVIGNWQKELSRLAPQMKSLVLHGSKRRESFHAIDTSDLVITGYPQLQLDGEELLAHEFSFVVLDEAQTIKNPHAKVSQAARALRAEHHLCLTGTPMENHLGELWSLLEFAQPGLLGTEQAFSRQYRTPIEKNGDRVRSDSLTRRVAPFILRRTKDVVAKELPERTQVVESIVMDEGQRDLYDSIRLAMHGRVREIIEQHGLARSRITVLDALLKLRQACCDPRLLAASGSAPASGSGNTSPPGSDASTATIASAKMEWLSTALPELVAEGRRVLVFSQFTSMLTLIEAAVAQMSIPCLVLTGATRDRERLVERFQAGEAPVFLISLKAGGTGLNLTAADTVIHYDPWWNPAAEAQASDRAHRIGQDKPVFIHKLICQNTVEEKILQLQADKQSLADRLYTGRNAAPGEWSAAELEALFAP